ncbi:related to gibberellin 20-oxidase [Phialocephala subalpina]|uniref:Related to gibberellin 20-oxidase n=1 Tax=Phialocephala subalpina TaxID=576137 RepID=A0A1L7WSZ2_9HELO|nr:related to gibberellin 20-oxidase [Phialocephala subalpina]
MDSSCDTPDIPLIDFGPFLHGSARDRAQVASSIDAAFRCHGFIYLSNHGIEQGKLDECFEWSRRFFGLIEEEKKKMQSLHYRGYSGVGNEKVREHICMKEGFGCGNPEDVSQPNIWPPEELLPDFRAFMEDFFQCTILVHHLLDSLSLALDLSSTDSLSEKHIHSLFNFDLLHYPAVPTQLLHSGNIARIPPHSDFGTLTLLFQDNVGGLEIADLGSANTEKSAEFEKYGSFKLVKPVLGTAVVNIGYLLMRWSNGRWKNTIHRVVGPPMREASTNSDNPRTVEDTTPERYSVPFFAVPDPETVVEALPGCWNIDVPKKWKPMHAGNFLRRKRKGIYA